MQPAKGAHPCETARQDVLEEPTHEVQWAQQQRGVLAGLAVAIVPAHFAIGQALNDAVGGGGLENVTGEITQGVLTGAGRAAIHDPVTLPHFGWHLGEEVGMVLLKLVFEEGTEVSAQWFDADQKLFAGRNPLASVRAEA